MVNIKERIKYIHLLSSILFKKINSKIINYNRNKYIINIQNFDNFIHKKPIKYDNIRFIDRNKKIIDLNNIRGNIFILNFWASWCPACKSTLLSPEKLKILVILTIYKYI